MFLSLSPCGVLGQVYLIVSIPDLCLLAYFVALQYNYVDTLKRELIGTYAYERQALLCERFVVGWHGCHTALNFGAKAKKYVI